MPTWSERLNDLSYELALARQFKTKGNAESYATMRNALVEEIEAAVAVAEAESAFRQRPFGRKHEKAAAEALDAATSVYRALKEKSAAGKDVT